MFRGILRGLLLLSAFWAGVATSGVASAEVPCARIVSLAPSVTEVLYDLGLGANVVGRTRFCRYPPESLQVPAVGGLYDLSLEAIVTLKPTHIVTPQESADIARKAKRFGIQVIEVDHASISGIKDSIGKIGVLCGARPRAEERLLSLAEREQAVQARIADKTHLRTLVVVGRTHERSGVSSVYVSGSDGFYSDVLQLVGALNVNNKPTVAIPLLSPEGLLSLAPDAIVEIINVDDENRSDGGEKLWNTFAAVPAVKNHRIYMVSDEFASIPGPRYIELVEKLAGLLHANATK